MVHRQTGQKALCSAIVILLMSPIGFVSASTTGWTERPVLKSTYGVFRDDRDFSLSSSGGYRYLLPWSPHLSWETNSRLYHAGTLDRDKRDSRLTTTASFDPVSFLGLSLITEGWRTKDTGGQSFERSRGAAAKGTMSIELPQAVGIDQTVAVVRDVVATAALGGEEHDNGGAEASTRAWMRRHVGTRIFAAELRQSVADLRLLGRDEKSVAVRLEGTGPRLGFEVFDRERRYQSGSIEEHRAELGRSLSVALDVGSGDAKALSCEYSASKAKTSYREGTNQDFSLEGQQADIEFTPFAGNPWGRFWIKSQLRHLLHEERDRTIYDREEIGRNLEMRLEGPFLDSLAAFSIGHSISLNKHVYFDELNFSDHDIRDQKLSASLSLLLCRSSWILKLLRRRNDLVYIDGSRSANTTETDEYSAAVDCGLQLGKGWRWTQSFLISARYVNYRFRPGQDELSRRGLVDTELTGSAGGLECRVFQKWLWDDNGPFVGDLFQRSELIDDVEAGIGINAVIDNCRLGPSWRQRWRSVYGPRGRDGGSVYPLLRESWVSLDASSPFFDGGTLSLSITAVISQYGTSYMRANVRIQKTW